MKKHVPTLMLMVAALAIAGCTQEANQAQTAEESSQEITVVEPSDPAETVEHSTLKPDTSEVAGSSELETSEPTDSEIPAVDEAEPVEQASEDNQ